MDRRSTADWEQRIAQQVRELRLLAQLDQRALAELPVEERHYHPVDTECCGRAMKEIAAEVVELLDYQPAVYQRVRIVKHKRVCVVSDHRVVRATAPETAFAASSVTPALVASVITAKYGDHLPLHRQVDIAARHGVEFRKPTMCGWLSEAAFALQPVYRELKRLMLASAFVHTDDTSILIQDKTAPGGSRDGYLWTYHGDQGDVIYDYTTRRKGEGPRDILGTFRGYVVADAHVAFDGLFLPGSGRTEVA